MQHELKQGQRFKYIGPGDGKGVMHTVVGVYPDQVVTWSDPSARFNGGGFSWLGSRSEFKECFS